MVRYNRCGRAPKALLFSENAVTTARRYVVKSVIAAALVVEPLPRLRVIGYLTNLRLPGPAT